MPKGSGKKDGHGPEELRGKRYFIGRNSLQKQKRRVKPDLNYTGKARMFYDKSGDK
jgi:hypothetical protein